MKKILLSIILFGSLSAFTAYNGISNESITTNDANVRAYMVIDTGGPNAYFYTIPCTQSRTLSQISYLEESSLYRMLIHCCMCCISTSNFSHTHHHSSLLVWHPFHLFHTLVTTTWQRRKN